MNNAVIKINGLDQEEVLASPYMGDFILHEDFTKISRLNSSTKTSEESVYEEALDEAKRNYERTVRVVNYLNLFEKENLIQNKAELVSFLVKNKKTISAIESSLVIFGKSEAFEKLESISLGLLSEPESSEQYVHITFLLDPELSVERLIELEDSFRGYYKEAVTQSLIEFDFS